MPTTEDDTIGHLLRASRSGSERASRALFQCLYRELRSMARQQLARERRGHTLAPTSLVHEVFVRLHGTDLEGADRAQFLRLVAAVMRNVLVDSARRHHVRTRIERAAMRAAPERPRDDLVLRLDAAMQRLGAVDAQLLQVAELRFLVELSVEETARVLGCSTATVKRDWRTARAFLQRELERDAR